MIELPKVTWPRAVPSEPSESITKVALSPKVVRPTYVLATPPFALVSQLKLPLPALTPCE